MTTGVVCVTPQQPLVDLKHIYEKRDFHHHIPVVENDVLTGMVSLVDYLRVAGEASLDDNDPVYTSRTVGDVMSIHPVSVDETATIAEVAAMLAKGAFSSVVITRDRKVAGIVTTTDLIRYFLK